MELITVKMKDIKLVFNSRDAEEDVSDLIESIKKVGLVSPPIICNDFKKSKTKKYIIVAGNRRFHALKKLGHKEYDFFLTELVTTEKQLILHNMSENIARKDITPYQEGLVYRKMAKSYKMSAKEIAASLGTSKSRVERCLDVIKFVPTEFRDKVVYVPKGSIPSKGNISISASAFISSMAKSGTITNTQKKQIYQKCIMESASLSETKGITRLVVGGLDIEDAAKKQSKITIVRFDLPLIKSEHESMSKNNLTARVFNLLYGRKDTAFTKPS